MLITIWLFDNTLLAHRRKAQLEAQAMREVYDMHEKRAYAYLQLLNRN